MGRTLTYGLLVFTLNARISVHADLSVVNRNHVLPLLPLCNVSTWLCFLVDVYNYVVVYSWIDSYVLQASFYGLKLARNARRSIPLIFLC